MLWFKGFSLWVPIGQPCQRNRGCDAKEASNSDRKESLEKSEVNTRGLKQSLQESRLLENGKELENYSVIASR